MKLSRPIAAGCALAFAAAAVGAFDILPYSADALHHAGRTDSPIALHFHSKWCGTCRLQSKVFEQLRSEPGLDLKLLVVDFDSDDDTVQAFRVLTPGAVIVMRGSVERARLLGVTARDDLVVGLRKAF